MMRRVDSRRKISKTEIQERNWWPKSEQKWPISSDLDSELAFPELAEARFKEYFNQFEWEFPEHEVHVIADLHADANGLFNSLIGGGLIYKYGSKDHEFELTPKAKEIELIINGDCLDKGHSNLRLLDVIADLKHKGMWITLIAGNHDIRTFCGLTISESPSLIAEHMFVRMGKKTIPLFKEIYHQYLSQEEIDAVTLSDEEIKSIIFPTPEWFEIYTSAMQGIIPEDKLKKETKRIREKILDVTYYLKKTQISYQILYATILKARELFLQEGGKYFWFFNEMQICKRYGSFLFVHAGLDNHAALQIHDKGIDYLNQEFNRLQDQHPFELYHGYIGNMFRTKYRSENFPLSDALSKIVKQSGIYAIVQGHVNSVEGHRALFKQNILHIECDTSLDRNTRKIEGLPEYGASILQFLPKEKKVLAASTEQNSTYVMQI